MLALLFATSPGIPALVVLAIATAAAACLGARTTGGGGTVAGFFRNASEKSRAVATATVAFPFWVWAVYKVATQGDKDLGAASFALVMLAAGVVAKGSNGNGARLLVAANALVSLNYAYPIFLYDLPSTFLLYLVVGVVYWAAVAMWNWKGRSGFRVLP